MRIPRGFTWVPRGVVLKYYLYNVTLSQGLVTPVVVEYLLSRGLSFSQVGTTGAVFMAGWVLGEVPTGYVGDRVGRRNSLVMASLVTALAIAVLGVGRSFPTFVLAYALWALGVTFRSGAGSAWLYEVLEERAGEAEFARVKGRGWSVRLVVTAATSVVGSYLASVAWILPFAANATLIAAGVFVLATFPKTRQFADAGDEKADAGGDGDGGAGGSALTITEALPVIREQFARSSLRGFVVYMALFFGLVEVSLTYVQPVSTDLGVRVAHLGWLYAGFSLASAAASYLAGPVKERFGMRRWFLYAPPALAVLFVGAVAAPLVALPAFFVMRFVRSLTGTFRSQYLNDHIESVGRATTLSAASMVFALTAAVTRQVGGVVADLTSPIRMLGLFAAVFVASTVVLHRVESPTSRVESPVEGQPTD